MRQKLFSLLFHSTNEQLAQAIRGGELEAFVPGLSLMSGCSQGNLQHFEGDVNAHTALVIAKQKEHKEEDPQLYFDGIDLLAGLMHDLEKPATRTEIEPGVVKFPGHEAKAALRVAEVASRLSLTSPEEEKLYFLVSEHGNAHHFPILSLEQIEKLLRSPYWRNLRLLQKADAESCYLNMEGTKTLPVHWELFDKVSFGK